jgi:MFS family permease
LALRSIPGLGGSGGNGRSYIFALKALLKNRIIIRVAIANGIRVMGTQSVFAFFSLYCREDLNFSATKVGFYYALMMTSGIVSQPFLGYLSDRFGRKIVIVPSLILMGVFEILLVWSGAGFGLALVTMCIGLFIYAIGAIIQAAVMDIVPVETGASTIALLFGTSALFSVPSPTLAGWLSGHYGTPYVFLCSGALMILAAFIFLSLPMKSKLASDSSSVRN